MVATVSRMTAEIETDLDQLLSIQQDAPGIVSGLTDEQVNWRQAPGRWSIAECYEHLNVTTDLNLPALDAAIERGRSAGMTSPGPFAYGWFERAWARNADAPPRFRMRAPRRFQPAAAGVSSYRAEVVLQRFMERQAQLQERIRRADGLDLRRIRVVVPAVRILRVGLGSTFAILLAHERRHLWQAREVRKALERASAAAPQPANAGR